MRMLRYIDFDCPLCQTPHTRFVYFDTETRLPCDPEECGENMMNYDGVCCDGVLVPREIGFTPPLMAPLAGKDVKTNMDDANRQRERLEKRQDEHWKRQGRDEAIERERAILRKNGMEGAGGVK